MLAALGALAGAQTPPPAITCNLGSTRTILQATDSNAELSDLIIKCYGGTVNTNNSFPLPTLNWTLVLPQPVTSRIISTSGGNVSDALLLIDDAGSMLSPGPQPPGFGSNAPPTLCASVPKGCPAYPNVIGGIPVMTSAPDPLGSPNPIPPAANIYQGVVNINAVTFFGVPILPTGSTGARTYRITNIRVNPGAVSGTSVIGSLNLQGYGAYQITLNQTQAVLATTVQPANTIFLAGYNFPSPVHVAPGQIVNFLVKGIGNKLPGLLTASSFPLPTVLGGISVNLTETLGPPGPTRSFPVPILALLGSGDSWRITTQIPFEISTASPNPARLVVSENGVPGSAFEIIPVPDQVHAARYCDLDANTGPCGQVIVAHASGVPVSLSIPAKVGEELVLYAFGLGATMPAVATGQAAPGPAPVTQPLQLNFEYRPNAAPSNLVTYPDICKTTPVCSQVQPVYAGLTAGYAGLYQVNFVVPPPPPGTPRCTVASNLTVSIIASNSFDGGGICVDTTSPGS